MLCWSRGIFLCVAFNDSFGLIPLSEPPLTWRPTSQAFYGPREQRQKIILLHFRWQYLTRIQNSVLEVQLSPGVFAKLKQDVKRVINEEEDSVIFYTWRSEQYTKREMMRAERGTLDEFI